MSTAAGISDYLTSPASGRTAARCSFYQHITSSYFVQKYSFSLIKSGFVIFCQKNISAKAAHKMLVKLTTDQLNLRRVRPRRRRRSWGRSRKASIALSWTERSRLSSQGSRKKEGSFYRSASITVL